ncbi:MAG: AcvB/VirJ family lysyl-phosphatidylglycerol hydrolase [Acidobacteriota bacterium]
MKGSAEFDKIMAAGLAAAGMASAGWSSLEEVTPDAWTPDAADRPARSSHARHKDRVRLVCYSFDPDVLPFLVIRRGGSRHLAHRSPQHNSLRIDPLAI